jgi:hypothetical protein
MDAMRAEVARLIADDVQPAAAQGEIGRGRVRDCGTNSNAKPDRVEHVIARLKRDDPALAERGVNGEITANAAARAKGSLPRPRGPHSSPPN